MAPVRPMRSIVVDIDLLDNCKLNLLAKNLGLSSSAGFPYALMLTMALWTWVGKHAPDGVIPGTKRERLLAYLEGKVVPPVKSEVDLFEALVKTGFIEKFSDESGDGYVIHKWQNYQSLRLGKRRRDTKRTQSAPVVRANRATRSAATSKADSSGFALQEKGSHTLLKELVLDSSLDSKQDSKDSPPISPPQRPAKGATRTKNPEPVEKLKPHRSKLKPSEAPYSQLLLSPHLLELCSRELRDTTTIYRELDQYLEAAFTEPFFARMSAIYPSIDVRRVAVKLLKYNIEQSVRRLKYKDFQDTLSDWMSSANSRGYPLLKGGYTHEVEAPPGSEVNFEFGPPQAKQECLEGV